ncbi:DUF2336 domain-containing protein [Bradyrhizobium sp. HKCCYLS20291]|uniref:DUF2336 domain-containing protein n=1 Tax=Bradyrhizobium sp. HKCCYLS20291 TaxID=3420766 RepID=UPI003EBFBD25
MHQSEQLPQPDRSIISELEDAVRSGSSEKRVHTLRQVTNLFLHDGERLSEEQIKVFDDVLCMLVSRVETRARSELSKHLAPVDHAPVEVIQRLARDEEISVAESVLMHSTRLSEHTLVEVAATKGQDHLMAISSRPHLTEAITDIIVDRGERRVIRKLANNQTARFSETGYTGMVAHAEDDDELTEIIGLRVDLPNRHLRDLLRRATDAVRAKMMASAPPVLQQEIKKVIKSIADVARTDGGLVGRDFTLAEEAVKRMKGLNELNDPAISFFAETRRFSEVAAALGLLNNLPTEMMAKVLEGPRTDIVLIPCRAAGLPWSVVAKILTHRPIKHGIDSDTLKLAERDYARLSHDTAQRTLRFWMVHNRVEK